MKITTPWGSVIHTDKYILHRERSWEGVRSGWNELVLETQELSGGLTESLHFPGESG